MNTEYECVGIVENFQEPHERYSLIQSDDDVDQTNQDHGTDFHYFLIEWLNESPHKLYGMYGCHLSDEVYFVCDL